MRELSLRFLLAFLLCIGFGIAFGYIATAVGNKSIAHFDTSIIQIVQGWETPWLTAVMTVFTWIGSGFVVALIAVIVAAILYFKMHYRHQAFLFLVVIIGTPLLNGLLKLYFKRERPEIHRILDANGFSFPSGHTMMAFSLYAIIAYIAWRNVKTVASRILLLLSATFMILIIGISRIYLGVHYPSDIVGGIMASALWLTFATAVYGYFQHKHEKKIRPLSAKL